MPLAQALMAYLANHPYKDVRNLIEAIARLEKIEEAQKSAKRVRTSAKADEVPYQPAPRPGTAAAASDAIGV